MFNGIFERTPSSEFITIGIIAGSGPEAGVDLWSKLLRAARNRLGERYEGDWSAPFVRVISDPTLGLAVTKRTSRLVEQHLRTAIYQASHTCGVFSIACNALQARAKKLMPRKVSKAFAGFDDAVDVKLAEIGASEFFLIGSSAVMSLTADSIYAPLKAKYTISTPSDWGAVDDLIKDIKLLRSGTKSVAQRLEALVAQGGSLPVVLACTDFPLVSADLSHYKTIDGTEALADLLISIAVSRR